MCSLGLLNLSTLCSGDGGGSGRRRGRGLRLILGVVVLIRATEFEHTVFWGWRGEWEEEGERIKVNTWGSRACLHFSLW